MKLLFSNKTIIRISLVILLSFSASVKAQEGKYRWDVKIGIDTAGQSSNSILNLLIWTFMLPVLDAISFESIIEKGGHTKPWVVIVGTDDSVHPYVVKLYRARAL